MEVYIDDMLVKSQHSKDHITHLRQCFDTLNKYGMKLNPAKCTFAVKSGEFLGYLVTRQCIEANPKQIKAIIDLPLPKNAREEKPNQHPSTLQTTDGSCTWTVHPLTLGRELIRLTLPTGEILEQSFRLRFQATNNVAEYEALIVGLRLANGMQIKRIRAFCDSQLIANQFSGEYDTKSEPMDAYLDVVRILSKRFDEFELIKIPRGDNVPADALAALASTSDPDLQRIILVESIDTPSIGKTHTETCLALHQPNKIRTTYRTMRSRRGCEPPSENDVTDWRVEIRAYVADGDVPTDKWARQRLKAKAARYTLMKDHLLRWTALGAMLLCIHGDDTERVMMETHEGAGGNHSGGRALALRIKKHGHYWPIAKAPYPFMRWAMDIIGPPPTSRQKRYILVLTDYFFTKMVEAESYANIKAKDVQLFVWKYIICRHGLPYEIVTDNGSQFISMQFKKFCARWRIKLRKSTLRYPQGNGQAEATNKTILDGLKKRLDAKKGVWADELDGVLWSYRTTPRTSTNQTPFSLAYGMEAMAPAEMLTDRLDELEEERDKALLRIQNYQLAAAKYYNKKVHNRHFDKGDLVLRKVFENTAEPDAVKMGANWEGPYLVLKVVHPSVYELLTMGGEPVPRSWNSMHLKRYYY
ncbi:PREDICTED: uncharacterized protein LOC104715243 [Camelina sativa]|uniref:Uncharacterized protein LOC104715243 n=1 Tax=Camelina sativa TaxID=90675 RepID=A0ABM1QFE9_CAMSA|nr:PREDICTED: uncharacterized protein LOC104715243 [Camelina sativa]